MDPHQQKQEKSFIHERIVPQRRKKILKRILATVGLAVLFGAVTATTFFVTERAWTQNEPKETESGKTTIIISRDDPSESEEEPGESESEEEGEKTTPSPWDIYNSVRGGFVKVTMSSPTGNDWFGNPIAEKTETFGIIVATSPKKIYILTDATSYHPAGDVYVTVSNLLTEAEVLGYDDWTKLMVVTIDRKTVEGEVTVVPLGNSLTCNIFDNAYLAGAQYGSAGCLDAGFITYYSSYEDTIDGYRQRFYTNMTRQNHTAAVLLNEKAQVVAWVSDIASGSQDIAIGMGISGLKYIIEDLCSENDTAFFGILGKTVTTADSTVSGLRSGLYVEEIIENSPAYEAGIQPGDYIEYFNGQGVTNSHSLLLYLDALNAGDTVSVTVERSGLHKTFSVTLGKR